MRIGLKGLNQCGYIEPFIAMLDKERLIRKDEPQILFASFHRPHVQNNIQAAPTLAQFHVRQARRHTERNDDARAKWKGCRDAGEFASPTRLRRGRVCWPSCRIKSSLPLSGFTAPIRSCPKYDVATESYSSTCHTVNSGLLTCDIHHELPQIQTSLLELSCHKQ